MACPGVVLHDIADAEAFALSVIAKLAPGLSREDREDLAQEALIILLDLAAAYRPAHAGKRESWRSFSGYAHEMLRNRLIDVLRKRRSRVRLPDGSRGWVAREVASLDALMDAPVFEQARMVSWERFERPPALAAAA